MRKKKTYLPNYQYTKNFYLFTIQQNGIITHLIHKSAENMWLFYFSTINPIFLMSTLPPTPTLLGSVGQGNLN